MMDKFRSWFEQFIILNLFVTLVSLPLMVAWGLPLSWLSPIGNLMFGPFLSIFLLLSTLSFFCSATTLPHTFLDSILEWLTCGWHLLLETAPDHSFVGFSTTALWIISLCSVLTFFLMLFPHFGSTRTRIALLTGLFCCSITVLKALQPTQLSGTIACKRKSIQIIKNSGYTALIDGGAFAERSNPSAWVQYHLITELIQKTGSTAIDYLVITRPTIRSFEAAATLMQHSTITQIYYPEITGTMTGSHRGAFRRFYAIAKEKGVAMQRVSSDCTIIMGDTRLQINVGKLIAYREVEYAGLSVSLVQAA